MVLNGILDGITKVISFISSLIPDWNLDDSSLFQSFDTILNYIEQANKLLPIDTLLTVIGIYCTFAICMFIYWSVNRLLNLIRGAG